MPRVTVEVTETDIRYGVCGDPRKCAIARAVKRLVKPRERPGVQVYPEELDTYDATYDLPKKARRFVEDFDEDKKRVKPFKFTVTLPKEILACSQN